MSIIKETSLMIAKTYEYVFIAHICKYTWFVRWHNMYAYFRLGFSM